MKINSLFQVILQATLLLGCSGNLPQTELEFRDGLYYQKEKTEPFTGKFILTFKSGMDSMTGSLINGKLDGSLTFFYENGKVKRTINYKLGEKIDSILYTEDGKVIEKNILEGKTFKSTYPTDILNFEQITMTLDFITHSSVRAFAINNFGKVYVNETLTYRIEDKFVIVAFSDESQSFEILENGTALKNSTGRIFDKQ